MGSWCWRPDFAEGYVVAGWICHSTDLCQAGRIKEAKTTLTCPSTALRMNFTLTPSDIRAKYVTQRKQGEMPEIIIK